MQLFQKTDHLKPASRLDFEKVSTFHDCLRSNRSYNLSVVLSQLQKNLQSEFPSSVYSQCPEFYTLKHSFIHPTHSKPKIYTRFDRSLLPWLESSA